MKFPFDGITVKVFRMPEDDGESIVMRSEVIYREWESPDLEDFQYLCREYGIKKAHRYGTRVNEIEFTSRELPGIGIYVVEVLSIGAWPVGTCKGDREVLEDLSRIVRAL